MGRLEEETKKGAVGESGLDWKDEDEDCGLVVEGKGARKKRNIYRMRDNR